MLNEGDPGRWRGPGFDLEPRETWRFQRDTQVYSSGAHDNDLQIRAASSTLKKKLVSFVAEKIQNSIPIQR